MKKYVGKTGDVRIRKRFAFLPLKDHRTGYEYWMEHVYIVEQMHRHYWYYCRFATEQEIKDYELARSKDSR